jgi:hypothetical protein
MRAEFLKSTRRFMDTSFAGALLNELVRQVSASPTRVREKPKNGFFTLNSEGPRIWFSIRRGF